MAARGKPFQAGNKMAANRGPNKVQTTVKANIIAVANELQTDPEFSLLTWAQNNLTDFYTKVYPKLLPVDVEGNITNEIKLHIVRGRANTQ